MNSISTLLVAMSGLLTLNTWAGVTGTITPVKSLVWVGSIGFGPVSPRGGDTQDLFLTSNIQKTYLAENLTNILANAEFFIGAQKELPFALQGQLGLALAAVSHARLSGNIWDDADPQFNNYYYSYKIQHTLVAAKVKLLADRGQKLIPWVSATLGAGFNKSYAFNNMPLFYEAVIMPNFSPNMHTSFTYTLGAGVQRKLNQHWQIGVGYEFSDWGRSALGRAEGQTMNSGLTQNHLYTNGAMMNLTFLA